VADHDRLRNTAVREEEEEEEERMDSEAGTDSGLTSLRAVWFLVLWYFFSGGTAVLFTIIIRPGVRLEYFGTVFSTLQRGGKNVRIVMDPL